MGRVGNEEGVVAGEHIRVELWEEWEMRRAW